MVAVINWVANGLLRILGVCAGEHGSSSRSVQEELRTVVNEAGAMISRRYKRMLVSILDLERVTVDDIMVPRSEINAIDLDDDRDEIEEQLVHSQHTRLVGLPTATSTT